MKNKTQVFILLLIIVTLAACRYDEGPAISFRTVENRVAQDFELIEFTKNDVDMTQELTDSCGQYWVFYDKHSGTLSYELRVVVSKHVEYSVMGGNWALNGNNKKLEIDTYHAYEGIEPFQNNITTIWKIERLTKKEFWLSCTYNNSDYYLKLNNSES